MGQGMRAGLGQLYAGQGYVGRDSRVRDMSAELAGQGMSGRDVGRHAGGHVGCMAVHGGQAGGQGISGLGMVGSTTAGIAADGTVMRSKAQEMQWQEGRCGWQSYQAGWARFVMACGGVR